VSALPASATVRRHAAAVAPVAVGLVLVGVAAYGILALAARALTPRDYAAVAATYFLITIAGTGVFTAVEQETNRAISGRSVGARADESIGAAGVVAAALALLVAGAALLLGPVLVDRVLAGHQALLWCLVLGIAGAAALSVLRGVYGGAGRYGWYASTVAGEGIGRLVPVAVLVAVGALTAALIGGAFAIGTVLAATATAVGLRRCGLRIRRPSSGSLKALGAGVLLLVGASTLTFFMANMAPVAVTARVTADPAIAASFASAAVLSRVPLFLFSPAQAFLLPPLTRAAGERDTSRLRRHLRGVLAVVTAFGACAVGATAALGPAVSSIAFAAPIDLSHGLFAAMALGTALMLVAQVLQPALVAMGLHRAATAAWVVGAAVFTVLLVLPGEAVTLAVAAQVIGPVMVVAVMGAVLVRRVRSWERAAAESVTADG